MNPLDLLADRQLVVVTGKGGVGKTTIAAVVGRALALAGRRVTVLECDPRESLYQMLGVAPSGGERVDAGPRLAFRNLKPRAELDAVVRDRLPLEFLTRRVLASPVYQHFADAAPGMKELAILGHAYRLVGAASGRGPADCVVLDAPATGHGLTLLTAPAVVAQAIGAGPIGKMAEELRAWVEDPARCAVVVVTQAEDMPVAEALELGEALRRRGGGEALLVANGLYPPLPAGTEPADPWLALWIAERTGNERELARLAAGWSGPRVALPLLALERGPALVEALRRRFEGGGEPWT
ncbi:MAG: ArsA family ATPase [Acidobacteriota bacterium]